MTPAMVAHRDAVFLSVMGLLVGLGIVMHVWGTIEKGIKDGWTVTTNEFTDTLGGP